MPTHSLYGHGAQKVIALHGLFDTRDVFQPMTAGFDPSAWQIAMPDIRGFGAARSLDGPYDLGAIAADALALANSLGWPHFSVIGHSMSSKAALRIALSARDRVERIVAVAPVWAGRVPLDENAFAWFRSSATQLNVREEIIASVTGRRLPAFWSKQYAASSVATSREDAYAAYVDAFVQDDFAKDTHAISQPILVILGEADMTTAEAVKTTWLTDLPDARLELIPDAGHWPMLETPLLLSGLIERFLNPNS